MKPAKIRRSREELQKEAEAMFIPEDAENPFLPKYTPPVVCETCRKPKLPCHVPNCNDPNCDRLHICEHDRLNEDGYCRRCGEDRRGI